MVNYVHQLLNKGMDKKEIYTDWKKGLLVKFPKSGDITMWQGITRLFIPSKVLNRIILMKDEGCIG